MIHNIFKTAFRNFKKNRLISGINVLGLSLGIAVCLILFQYVAYELSYDKFNHDSELVYRIERNPFAGIAPSFAPLLKKDFPEIDEIGRMTAGWNMTIKNEENVFNEENVCFAEPAILDILTFDFVEGERLGALKQGNIVLTESMTRKYFGSENPIGKTLLLDNELPLTVSGVIADYPKNSHLKCDFLCSYLSLRDYSVNLDDDYFLGDNNFSDNVVYAYARFHKNADIDRFESALADFIDRHIPPHRGGTDTQIKASQDIHFTVRKVTDIHLQSHKINEVRANSDISYIYIFSVLGVLIIAIACINFFNLSTATVRNRFSEIGIKKVFGITKKAIYLQFIFESFLLVFLATVLALGLNFLAIPYLKSFLKISSGSHFVSLFQLIQLTIVLVFILSIITGLAPAKYLVRHKSLLIFKNNPVVSSGKIGYRNVLVVFQFIVAIGLFVSVGTIYKQMDFLNHKELGFKRDNILLVPANEFVKENWQTIHLQLLNNASIEEAALSKNTIGGRLTDAPGLNIELSGKWKSWAHSIPHIRTDFNFFKTYDIPILAGRDFNSELITDRTNAFILNETAVRQIGIKNYADVIGKRVRTGNRTGEIIGVVKDFHYESLHSRIVPMVAYISLNSTYLLSVNVTQCTPEIIAYVKEVLDRFSTDYQFTHRLLEDRLADQYLNESRMMLLTAFAAVLAVFIAALGLLGLSIHRTKNKIKEVGIRKVNGARISEVMALLNIDLIKWVAIAFVIAIPIAYYAMNKWLENFAYKTALSWWIFALAGLLALGIALLTVSWQSWKAATRNPVDALRYE